jgi:hypothetical protein
MARVKLTHTNDTPYTRIKRWRKGVEIPTEVIDATRKYGMRMSEIITYIALTNHMSLDEELTAHPTVVASCQDIADCIGIYNKETIRVNVNSLEAKGLIKIERGGLTNVYTLVGFKVKKFKEGKVRNETA